MLVTFIVLFIVLILGVRDPKEKKVALNGKSTSNLISTNSVKTESEVFRMHQPFVLLVRAS